MWKPRRKSWPRRRQLSAPLVKTASDYYAQKGYKNDGAKRGQELHSEMMPLFEQAFAAEAALRRDLRGVKEDVARRNLAQLEKEKGKNFEWHLRTFLLAAETVGDLLPSRVDAPLIDGTRYKPRFANLETAYTAFKQFSAAHPEEAKLVSYLGTSVEDFFGVSKLLRQVLESPKPDKQLYLTKVSELAAKVRGTRTTGDHSTIGLQKGPPDPVKICRLTPILYSRAASCAVGRVVSASCCVNT